MEALLHNFITATGWSILHSLWQGALIYGLLLLAQSNIVQLKATTKYVLAYSALSLMFACFIYTFFSVFRWPVNDASVTGILPADIARQNLSVIPVRLTQYAELFFPYLVCMYIAGLGVQSILVYSGYRKISKLKRAASEQIPENWKSLLENLTRQLSIKKQVTFRLSARINVPLVIGYLKPVILFPIALAAQMDLKQVEAILIHELSHIRRNDYLFNLIRTMMDTLLFFNPFIWLTGKFIDIEREHACDDLVLELTKTPMTYAHALLQIELLTEKSSPAFALAASGKNQHLYQRIKRITAMKTSYMNPRQKLFAVTITIATIISLAWINPAKHEVKQQDIVLQKHDHRNENPVKRAEQSLNLSFSAEHEPADTTKKKHNKKTLIKGSKDSCDFVINEDGGIDSNISLAIKDAMEPLRNLHIQIDSVPGPDFYKSIGDLKIMVAEALKMGSVSPQDTARLSKITKVMVLRGKKIEQEMNDPKERAKWEAYAKEIQAKFDTPEQRKKFRKLGEQLARQNKQLRLSIGMPHPDENPDSRIQEIQNSREYIELQKKFNKDVQSLMEKKNKKEKDKN